MSYDGPSSGWTRTDTSGSYDVTLDPGTYTVSARWYWRTCRADSPGGPPSVDVSISSGGARTVDWYC